jgi:hypothetical protein
MNNPSGYITGVNLNNYVTLNTTQSISGLKTFNSGIVSSNVISPIIYSTGTGLTISGAGGVIGYDINIYGGRGGIGKGGDVNISGGSHGSNGSFGDASIFGNSINLSSYSDSYIKMTYGNFGIQTDSPQYTLDVNGNGNFSNGLYVNGVSGISLSINYMKTASTSGTLTFTNGLLTSST